MIAITLGEPAGIGLELVAQLFKEEMLNNCVLIGDQDLVHQSIPDFPASHIHHIPIKDSVKLGHLNTKNAIYVLEAISAAVNGCLDGTYQAMVTCPIHKGVINDAGVQFSGHTEFLAELTATDKVIMMLLNDVMRVALVTTHLPLKDVSDHVTFDAVVETCEIVAYDLKLKFGIESPQIALCGLNPHAGESGHMGLEEIETIIPAINYLKSKGIGSSVNITLGLPIIRTSVDHGTALDIAGQGKADAGSLRAALSCAQDCVRKQQ